MRRAFADTFYWLALSSPKDQWHEAVVQTAAFLTPFVIVTTEKVLTEYLTGMSGQGSYRRGGAVITVRDILADTGIRVIPQTHESFIQGLDLYERRGDKGYSMTDCISLNVCRAEGITDILTNDHYFAQEGFHILISR